MDFFFFFLDITIFQPCAEKPYKFIHFRWTSRGSVTADGPKSHHILMFVMDYIFLHIRKDTVAEILAGLCLGDWQHYKNDTSHCSKPCTSL